MKDIITPAPAGIDPAPSSPDHDGARPSFCNTNDPTSERKNRPLVAAGTIRISSTAVPHPVKGWQAKRIVRAWDGNDAKKQQCPRAMHGNFFRAHVAAMETEPRVGDCRLN